jgi:hypothetical protein
MMFLVFSDGFNELMSKMKKKLKKIHFDAFFKRKTLLKSTIHYNPKHPRRDKGKPVRRHQERTLR